MPERKERSTSYAVSGAAHEAQCSCPRQARPHRVLPLGRRTPSDLQNESSRGLSAASLAEEFGPVVGASPVAFLSVIGRNMVGRLKVAPPGAMLDEPAKPIEVAELLKGDNSEEAFSQLVREHARSGVSGILPKFLDIEKQKRAEFNQRDVASLGVERDSSEPSEPFGYVDSPIGSFQSMIVVFLISGRGRWFGANRETLRSRRVGFPTVIRSSGQI